MPAVSDDEAPPEAPFPMAPPSDIEDWLGADLEEWLPDDIPGVGPEEGHPSDDPDASPPPRVVVHLPFDAPVQHRHRMAKYDWLNNPFLPRIHGLCLQHVMLLGMRPTHTQNTLKCLSDDGLGPCALTEPAMKMVVRNTTDFRLYLEETIPRTNTSCNAPFFRSFSVKNHGSCITFFCLHHTQRSFASAWRTSRAPARR